MIQQWQIFVDGEFKAVVRSITEEGAIEFWYLQFGGASKYSGISRDSITAVKVD